MITTSSDLYIWCRLHGWRQRGALGYIRGPFYAQAFIWENPEQILNYLMAWMTVIARS